RRVPEQLHLGGPTLGLVLAGEGRVSDAGAEVKSQDCSWGPPSLGREWRRNGLLQRRWSMGLSRPRPHAPPTAGPSPLALLFSRPDGDQMFAIAIFLFPLFRLPIEVDLFWQFQIPTVLLSMIWVYLGLPRRRRSGEPRASVYLRRSPLRLGRTHPVHG